MKYFLVFATVFLFFSCQNKYHIAPHSADNEGVAIGQYVYNFKEINPQKEYISLESAMGKATIIDFWASWCRPCREAANPAYLKLYKQYHNKGLNIIGVSSDRHSYFWQKALQQDSLPWTQVIDSTKQILKKYEVQKIPTMFLIDQNGKIVGRNLWGEELQGKIDSLLAD
jgi:thiol-disulfide isomerase/thioredoxin